MSVEERNDNVEDQDSPAAELESPVVDAENNIDAPVDEIKDRAKKTGHLSYEEFVAKGGKPEDYKSEREFVMVGKLTDLEKAIQKRDRDIEEILKYNKDTIEKHKIKMREELEARLIQAKHHGDLDQVERLIQEKTEMDINSANEQRAAQGKQLQELDQQFFSRNISWYNDQNPELVRRAQEVSQLIHRQYPAIQYADLLKETERQMKFELGRDDRYAHLVIDPNSVSRPSMTSSGSAIAKSQVTHSDSEEAAYGKLNRNQKARFDSINRMAAKVGGKMTVREFLEDERRDEEI